MTAATQTISPPTHDERVMAALAHISIIIPLMGAVLPGVIWVTQKEKSRYVAFQALQALALQLAVVVGWIAGMGCYTLSFFGIFLTIPFNGGSGNVSPGEFLVFLPFGILGLLALAWVAVLIYAIAGAVLTLQGKDFRYALLGERVERFMQQ